MPPTGEVARIEDELRRAYDGDCWHGPPLRAILKGIMAATAEARHPQLVHSIWGLVNHLAAWVEFVALRIVEWRPIEQPVAGDFPAMNETGDAAWAAALGDLDRRHPALLDLVAGLDEARLDATLPGKDYPIAVMLRLAVQHYAYHAGQIALLKKLVS